MIDRVIEYLRGRRVNTRVTGTQLATFTDRDIIDKQLLMVKLLALKRMSYVQREGFLFRAALEYLHTGKNSDHLSLLEAVSSAIRAHQPCSNLPPRIPLRLRNHKLLTSLRAV